MDKEKKPDELIQESLQTIESMTKKFSYSKTISNNNVRKIYDLVDKEKMTQSLNKLSLEDMEYDSFAEICDFFKSTSEKLTQVYDDINLDIFYKTGKFLNTEKLRKSFNYSGVFKKFPNFNFKEFEDVINNPPLEYKNENGETVHYDMLIVRKFIISLVQMLGSAMDLFIVNTGVEGSGKSAFTSQIQLWFYRTLFRIGLIDYKYDFKTMVYSSLEFYVNDLIDMKEDDYFRIMTLDEGSELNRINYRDETVVAFKDEMRIDRKNFRIKIVNLPQLGELDTSITLSRANFIFFCKVENETETGLLRKGLADLYIIPRASEIYSEKHKKNISRSFIKNQISEILSSKSDYYNGLPDSCIIKTIEFSEVWGFDKDAYDVYIKRQNKTKRLTKAQKLTDINAFIFIKYMPPLSAWQFKDDEKDQMMYETFRKFVRKLDTYFKLNPELANKIDMKYDIKADIKVKNKEKKEKLAKEKKDKKILEAQYDAQNGIEDVYKI